MGIAGLLGRCGERPEGQCQSRQFTRQQSKLLPRNPGTIRTPPPHLRNLEDSSATWSGQFASSPKVRKQDPCPSQAIRPSTCVAAFLCPPLMSVGTPPLFQSWSYASWTIDQPSCLPPATCRILCLQNSAPCDFPCSFGNWSWWGLSHCLVLLRMNRAHRLAASGLLKSAVGPLRSCVTMEGGSPGSTLHWIQPDHSRVLSARGVGRSGWREDRTEWSCFFVSRKTSCQKNIPQNMGRIGR